MADNSMTFSDTLMQLGGEDFLRELTEFMLNRIMEADVTQRINAEPHERSDKRETYRNGYRDRQYNTRPGTLDLRIPKLREGSYFPSFLEARRLSEKALNTVIQEAFMSGIEMALHCGHSISGHSESHMDIRRTLVFLCKENDYVKFIDGNVVSSPHRLFY